ncbi:MAG: GNAT family N-acetyltransferase [Clostridiales bacterium]|jgi:ribosomal protein S18 acetylase RimI-like enzyme|nr:GNAT family N-acetyltransferase [Clostridiales bacterium]
MCLTYTNELLNDNDIYAFYETLGWNAFLKLSKEQLLAAMSQSFYVVYVYCGNALIASGRVISDGVINGYLCGLGVLPDYRKRGIGGEIVEMLKEYCLEHNLHVQLLCDDDLVSYYSKMGFNKFTVGMKL